MNNLWVILLGTVIGQMIWPWFKQKLTAPPKPFTSDHPYVWECLRSECTFRVSSTHQDILDKIRINHEFKHEDWMKRG